MQQVRFVHIAQHIFEVEKRIDNHTNVGDGVVVVIDFKKPVCREPIHQEKEHVYSEQANNNIFLKSVLVQEIKIVREAGYGNQKVKVINDPVQSNGVGMTGDCNGYSSKKVINKKNLSPE